jgi:hypothetical protein
MGEGGVGGGDSGNQRMSVYVVLAALPLHWLVESGRPWAAALAASGGGSADTPSPAMMMMPSAPALRMARLVLLPRGATMVQHWAAKNLHYATLNIVQAMLTLLLLSHWLGCSFLVLLREDEHAEQWMPPSCW